MKFGQILVEPLANISILFLALLRRLETSSRYFYDFHKIEIQCNLLILVGDVYYFSIV